MSFEDQSTAIIERYQQLGSMKKTSKEFGCCEATVWKILKKNEVERFGTGGFEAASVDHDFFAREDQQAFYFAGLLMADGCVDSKRNRVRLALRATDRDVVDELVRRAKYQGNIPEYINKGGQHVELCIYSNKWKKDLKQFGVVPNKTDTACIPQWVQRHELYHHFLRGVCDGDGSIRSTKERVDGSESGFIVTIVGSYQIIQSFSDALKPIIGHGGKIWNRKYTGLWRWDVFAHREVCQFVRWIYESVDDGLFMERKHQTAMLASNTTVRRYRRTS